MHDSDAAVVAPPRSFRPGPAGLLGFLVLLTVFVACVASLPWTTAQVPDPADPSGRTMPRYDVKALDAVLLPPTWAPHSEDEAARLARYREAVAGAGHADAAPWFLLGTDKLGRDYFVRCLAGGGISLGIGLAAAMISVIIGTLYGTIAGWAGGRIDAALMRIVDVLYGLPYILLVVLLAVAMDGLIDRLEVSAIQRARETGVTNLPGWLEFVQGHRTAVNAMTLLVAIGAVSWLTMARVVRGQVLSLREQPFMEAARAIGVSLPGQFLRHLLPNLLGPIIVYATLTVPQAILQESFLSFLGIGVQEPLPSWGNLVSDGLSQLNPVHSRWWLLLWPCVLLGLTLLALNFVGESLREAFDPRRKVGRSG